MSQLIFEFPLPDDASVIEGEHLTVELGNGARLICSVPPWVKQVIHARMQLIMEIEGSPPDASPKTNGP